MRTEVKHIEKRFLTRWVLATSIGWPVGFIGSIILSYTVVNLIYPKETNLIVGISLGLAVGYSQWYVFKKFMNLSSWWIWSTAIGMGIPFIMTVAWAEFGGAQDNLIENEILGRFITGAIGGILIGLPQTRILRPFTEKTAWWPVASMLAWGFGWLCTAFAGLFGLLLGGFILGLMTGIFLLLVINNPVEAV